MRRALPVAVLLAGCRATEPTSVVSLPTIDAAPQREVVARPAPATAGDLEWRIVDKRLVEDPNGGLPKEMWVKVELWVGGQRLAAFNFQEPDCTSGVDEQDAKQKIVARLECYYAGGGDYVEVIERAPNDFEVVSYAQDESYEDEPNPPKEGMKVVARFRANAPLTTRLIEPNK